MNKFYSKSAVKFGLEVEGTEEIFARKAGTVVKESPTGRFFDSITGRIQTTIQSSGMTNAERTYLSLNTIIDSNLHTTSVDTGNNSITFEGISIATPPPNFPALTVQDFQVFINGVIAETSAITSITQVGSDVVIDFWVGL